MLFHVAQDRHRQHWPSYLHVCYQYGIYYSFQATSIIKRLMLQSPAIEVRVLQKHMRLLNTLDLLYVAMSVSLSTYPTLYCPSTYIPRSDCSRKSEGGPVSQLKLLQHLTYSTRISYKSVPNLDFFTGCSPNVCYSESLRSLGCSNVASYSTEHTYIEGTAQLSTSNSWLPYGCESIP